MEIVTIASHLRYITRISSRIPKNTPLKKTCHILLFFPSALYLWILSCSSCVFKMELQLKPFAPSLLEFMSSPNVFDTIKC